MYAGQVKRESLSGETLSCSLSMKSLPVRTSHIPEQTKEEAGPVPLCDTAGMRLRRERSSRMEKIEESACL